MSAEIIPIFPTAIYRARLRGLSIEENQVLSDDILTDVNRQGNKTSISSTLLDNPKLANLKLLFLQHVHAYAAEIIKTQCQFYMTNSWQNKNSQGQPHDLHNHRNSVLSGVFYINVENSQNSICFNRITPPFFMEFETSEYTSYNSIDWTIPVEDNMLIIFPSTLYHNVPINYTAVPRRSISFNTFVQGNFNNDTKVSSSLRTL